MTNKTMLKALALLAALVLLVAVKSPSAKSGLVTSGPNSGQIINIDSNYTGTQYPELEYDWLGKDRTKTKTENKAATTQPAPTAGCDYYRTIIAQYKDWPVDLMVAIMRAESTPDCNPQTPNPTDNHIVCLGSWGLFQIGCNHGYSKAQLFDPAFNIKVAYSIYKSQGITAWGAYTDGRYLEFL